MRRKTSKNTGTSEIGTTRIDIDAEDRVVVTWDGPEHRSSLSYLSADARAKKVNQLGRIELIAVRVSVVGAPFPLGMGATIYAEALAMLQDGSDEAREVLECSFARLPLGEMRLALVTKGLGEFNGPVDTYLDVAVAAAAKPVAGVAA